jgi:glycerol-3-phosphate cytidylyltransferase-like family protein
MALVFPNWSKFICRYQPQNIGSGHILISLYADPPTSAHYSYIKAANKLKKNIYYDPQKASYDNPRLIVCVNDDNHARQKKNYCFMPLEERLAILSEIDHIDWLIGIHKPDVSEIIRYIKPYIFANGGDRSTLDNQNQNEIDACREAGTILALGVGGYDKVVSSSKFFHDAMNEYNNSMAPNNFPSKKGSC